MPSLTRRTILAGGLALLGSAGAVKTIGSRLKDGTCARGDPVSVERDVSDDDVEYLPDTDEVRYAALMSGDEVVEYDTMPFDRWAKMTSASVGVEVVLPAIAERLHGKLDGVGRGVESRLGGAVITVDHGVRVDDDGAVVSAPNVDFDRLVSLAPRRVNARITLDGRDYARAVPVVVDHFEYRSDPAL